MELDIPTGGLDSGSNVHFQPACCIVAEIRREPVRSIHVDQFSGLPDSVAVEQTQ
jgi:hypothetical protein